MKLVLVLFLFLSTSIANSNTEVDVDYYEPAGLKESKWSLQNRIKFPKKILKTKNDVNVVIRCDALIERSGKFRNNFCYEGGDMYYPYVSAIDKAALKSTIKPARVNKSARKVYFQYYVIFMKNAGVASIEVIGNSGLEVDRYGVEYTSPQRYRTGGGTFGSGCAFGKKYSVNAVISEDGVAETVEVLGNSVNTMCNDRLVKAFYKHKYIPAIVNGKHVKSFYSEIIFYNYREQ